MPSTIGGKPVAIFAAATALGSFGVLATAASAQAAPSAVRTFARDTLVGNRSGGQMVTPDTQVAGWAWGSFSSKP
jgi:hypothetical protein